MLVDNFREMEQKIHRACEKYGRDPSSVSLLPVSKTFPASCVEQAVSLGYRRFGENKVQELKQKAIELSDKQLQWVVIGYLQTNKAKEVAKYASEVQSLDRLELALALEKRLQQEGRSLDVLIQVRTSPEERKTGMEPEAVPAFLDELRSFQTLKVKGLMTVAQHSPEIDVVRRCFSQVRQLAERLRQEKGLALPVLSMGMSGDYELAIAEGSTELRIGSALFGKRNYT